MLVNVNLRQQQCADTLLLLLLLLVCGQVPLLVGPGVRTIFVASDDSQWVEQQIKLVERTDPLWNIVTLAAPKPPKHVENGRNGGSESQSSSRDPVFGLGEEPYAGYFYMRSQGGTASGTYLMASMVRASFIFLEDTRNSYALISRVDPCHVTCGVSLYSCFVVRILVHFG